MCSQTTRLSEVVCHSANSSGTWSSYNSQMMLFIHLELVSPSQVSSFLIKNGFKDILMISHKRYFLFRIRDSSGMRKYMSRLFVHCQYTVSLYGLGRSIAFSTIEPCVSVSGHEIPGSSHMELVMFLFHLLESM